MAAAVMMVVVAEPQQGYGGQGGGGGDGGGGDGDAFPSAPAQYTFKWDVDDQATGSFYGHMEARNGDDTRGRSVVSSRNLTKITRLGKHQPGET